jgi:hypothetical protein
LLVIGVLAVGYLAWQYVEYLGAGSTLPAGMTIGQRAVGGMTRDRALNTIEGILYEPIEVTYLGQRLPPLAVSSVELRYGEVETAAELDSAIAESRGFNGFVSHVLKRPLEPIDVPVAVGYSDERLDGFLARVAGQYDRLPQGPVPLPASLTLRPGQPGQELDVAASHAVLVAALASATDRRAELVVRQTEAPVPDLDVLGLMFQSLLDNHSLLIPGIFVKDLQTGDELEINAEVAFAGLSVLKVAILEETYRALEAPVSLEVSDWISDSLGIVSSNFKANLLLRDVIGNGNGYQGAEILTASMHRLGLVNTFMATPYDEEVAPPAIITPANSRTDVNTNPDPYMQTTPLDIGLLLEMIYQCSHGGGGLMVAYPGAFTSDECDEMIAWLTQNRFDNLVEAGLPEGTVVAHKHGFGDGGPHADASIVFSPRGDFVLVVYMDSPSYLEWAESSLLIADIATATYNYFNPPQ